MMTAIEHADAIRKMIAALDAFENDALAMKDQAEEAWRLGDGSPAVVLNKAKRSDDMIRTAVEARIYANQDGDDLFSPLAYLQRVAKQPTSAFCARYVFGCDRDAELSVYHTDGES